MNQKLNNKNYKQKKVLSSEVQKKKFNPQNKCGYWWKQQQKQITTTTTKKSKQETWDKTDFRKLNIE